MKKKLKVLMSITLVLMLIFIQVGCGTSEPAPTPDPDPQDPVDEEPQDTPDEEPEEDLTTDVVVVGGGAAGLATAIEANREGARVILLEKMPFLGGSTLLSGGIVLATGSSMQESQGIEDSPEDLANYWYERAEGNADMEMLSFVAERAGETIDWLVDNGVVFSENITPAGTSPVPRAHTTASDRGFGLIQPLEAVAQSEGVEIMLQTRATNLVQDDNGHVIGVVAVNSNGEEFRIHSKAVVLATGGFDQSEDMKAEYAPVASGHISYANSGNTGDGLRMAKEVGAEIIAKDGVIGFRGLDGSVAYTSAIGGLIWNPHLYVDAEGNRFTNEVIDYPIFYTNMVENGSDHFYLIFDQDKYVEALDEAVERGYAYKADTLEELAGLTDMDETTFLATVDRYNELAANGEDADFGKLAALMSPIEEGAYYAVVVKPATLGTYGGPKINLDTEVLKSDGSNIPGLYAVGEVANGQFFYKEYPASGTSIQMCYTLGRIAGRNATAYATTK